MSGPSRRGPAVAFAGDPGKYFPMVTFEADPASGLRPENRVVEGGGAFCTVPLP